MKKNYIQPNMLVVNLNAEAGILAGSSFDLNSASSYSGGELGGRGRRGGYYDDEDDIDEEY